MHQQNFMCEPHIGQTIDEQHCTGQHLTLIRCGKFVEATVCNKQQRRVKGHNATLSSLAAYHKNARGDHARAHTTNPRNSLSLTSNFLPSHEKESSAEQSFAPSCTDPNAKFAPHHFYAMPVGPVCTCMPKKTCVSAVRAALRASAKGNKKKLV